METTMTTMREGDIFRWHYREPGDDQAWGRYHCCSNIAIVSPTGQLRDTYWVIGKSFSSDGRSFGPDDLPKLDLVYVGNFSDLEKANEYQGDYYDDADIVNLNHANSSTGNFYLRKGAKRSTAKMMETARRKLAKAESDIRMATCRVDEAKAAIARIEAGETDVYI